MKANDARQKLNSIYGNNPTAQSVLTQTATMGAVGGLKLAAKLANKLKSIDRGQNKKIASKVKDHVMKAIIYKLAKYHYAWQNSNGDRTMAGDVIDELKNLTSKGWLSRETARRLFPNYSDKI